MAIVFRGQIQKIIAMFLLTLLICHFGYCQEKNTSLSLKEAIDIAYKNNKDIQIQEKEIEASRAQILGAYGKFLPKLNATAGYTHNGIVLSISSATNSKKDIGVLTGYKNDNLLGISIDESLYNGGLDIANLRQAELGLNVSIETLIATKLDVELETKRLYYGLLLAYETERIAQELVDQAESHYEDVKNKFAQGTSSKFDLLQSKVQVSKLMPELIKAKNSVQLITADLRKLLGLKMQESIKLTGELAYFLIEIKEEDFLKQAYLSKPEMILKSLGVDITKWSIQAARAGWRPQISADLGYSYRSNNWLNMFNNRHSNWNAGVTVTIPIFDAFSTKAKVDEAKVRYAQVKLEKDDLIDQIAVDIKRACLDLRQAESIINSQKDNIEEAREALKIAEISYDNGEGTNLDVLDALVSLSQVEKNLSEAIYDYIMATAFLDRTMGYAYSPPNPPQAKNADPSLAEEEANNEKEY